jgi:hypothetical protein
LITKFSRIQKEFTTEAEAKEISLSKEQKVRFKNKMNKKQHFE